MAALPVFEEMTLQSKGRSVRRVIRAVEPRSVLRLSVAFYLCILAILLIAGVVLWLLAAALGLVGNLERFIGDLLAIEKFHFRVGQLLRSCTLGGLLLVALGAGSNVLLAVIYNHISGVAGGIEVAVSEEEPPSSAVV